MSKRNRRQALQLFGASAAMALFTESRTSPFSADAATTCSINTPTVTEGPYWVDEKLFRSDIRTDPATGVARQGLALALTINVVNSNANCAALVGAYVDIWHCDAIGIYSDESTYNPGGGTGAVNTTGQKFLRGYQITDGNGQVQFTTIYPGWYSGRTIHIHVRIRTFNGQTVLTNYTTQIFFDDTLNNAILAHATYKRSTARDTTNANDNVYSTGGANKDLMLATLTQTDSGYAAAITVDLAATAGSSTGPVIGSGGVVSAASGASGGAPGSWVAIFGTNLASSAYTATSSDLVAGYLPTTLQNVSVLINGKVAFLDYVSPTQLNVLAPSDASTGIVQVTVTNSGGTSPAVSATLQPLLPGLFVQSNYVVAVRPQDNAIILGTGASFPGYTTVAAARAGDVLEIYGTGFGSTSPSVAPGLVFSSGESYPTSNTVTASIGATPATVLFAGLVGAGLYQVNIQVPTAVAAGDQAIVLTLAGVSTQSNALLKIAAG